LGEKRNAQMEIEMRKIERWEAGMMEGSKKSRKEDEKGRQQECRQCRVVVS
jgi:hypothetical protein